MSAREAATRAGGRRGWIEFRNSLLSPSDLTYYLAGQAGLVLALLAYRDDEVGETGLSTAQFIIPNTLALVIVIGAVYGLATAVTTEREDGTLLRAKSVPNGMTGYVTGQCTRVTLESAFGLALTLTAATLLVDGLWQGGFATAAEVVALLLLGLLACTPLGFVIGALFRNPRSVGGWGMLAMALLVYVSGLFSTGDGLPTAVRLIGQVFPLHWLGAALRAVMLPDWAAGVEPGGEWRLPEAIAVLPAWAILGLLLAPRLLRRMARRESGSAVAERRETALKRV